jgi:PAS domain S-box-containing protein
MTRWRILIVAREPAAGAAIEVRAEGLGYEVTAVASPDELTGRVAATSPDLLLVDLGPGAGDAAVALAASVRREVPTPTVFMGPSSAEAALAHAAVPEPYGYVDGDADDDTLLRALGHALGKGMEQRAAHDLDAFFAVSLDMFAFLDFGGYFLRLNPAWERTLGYSPAEMMARPFIEFVHPEDRERTLRQNSQVRLGGSATAFENRYLHRDGSYRWLVWNSAPDPARGVIYAVARDITARKAAEEERARLHRELEASLAEVKTLQGILPICSYCRKIRDDEDYWHTVESYIGRHTGSQFSHGICPSCMTDLVEPLLDDDS